MTVSLTAAASAAAGRSRAVEIALTERNLRLVEPWHPSLGRTLLKAARPKQWVKNVLLLVAVAAAGKLTSAGPAAHALLGLAIFCLVSSSIYLINDVADREADRLHPKKRFRPIAAGTLSPRNAITAAVLGIVLAAVTALELEPIAFALVLALYVLLTVSYSLWLKHEPVVDIVAVAAGFVLRALAGAAAVAVAPSPLMLATVAFGALFMVAGKRYSERRELADRAVAHRASLNGYSLRFLRALMMLGGGGSAVLYTLWAIQPQPHHVQWLVALTALPFAAGILRYSRAIEAGLGGAPEEVVLRDRVLLVSALTLAACFLAGLYLPAL